MSSVNELTEMRRFYESGATRQYAFRKLQLQKLKKAVIKYEQQIFHALKTDLKKSKEESWVTENGFLLTEINTALKHLRQWMKPESVETNLLNLPSKSYILNEPLGVVLIISPWNYPFQLLLAPLVGAMAAGNCIVLKGSEFAPATSGIVKKIIEETFDREYIFFKNGDGATVIPEMMNNFVFDHVFYTGSTAIGKLIYQMAAKDLVPVTLELGGKSPCVVEADADIKVTARRIALPKYSNAGQMCVAPDFILVHSSKKDALIAELKNSISKFFGDDPQQSEDYGKIINEKQFDRLNDYLKQGKLIYGGNADRSNLYISPTIIEVSDTNDTIMQEEIFGPILPVISFDTKEQALKIINANRNPLAFYIFTSSKSNEKFWLEAVPFGGGCINNASWHLTNHHLPFGGRGTSGMGSYHGKYSFNTFSHQKGIMKTPTWFDPKIKYPPYRNKLKLFKMVIGR
jgi:aldehyde dehydrogenase (NAD+)